MSEAKEKKKGSNKLIVILLIFTLLIVFAVAGFFGYFFLFKKGNTAANTSSAAAAAQKTTEKTYQLEEFVTNLADKDTTYIKVTIVLGYEDTALDKEIPAKVVVIRDTINSFLWSKTSIDFSGKGLETVKKDLMKAINEKLETGKITNIYLNQIIIQ